MRWSAIGTYLVATSWLFPRSKLDWNLHEITSAIIGTSPGPLMSIINCYLNLQREPNRCWASASTEDSVQKSKLNHLKRKYQWGYGFAISRTQKSALCFLPKNWNASDLVEVFDKELLPSIKRPKSPSQKQRFVIDNDGRHQTTQWKQFAQQRHLHPLSPWPSNSPDLNPIENLFAWMKKFVEDEGPTDEDTLKEAITKAFSNIPVHHLAHLIGSLPHRFELTLKSNGARIKY